MVCSKCGAQLKDEAKFCPFCGEKVTISDATINEATTPSENIVEEVTLNETMPSGEDVFSTYENVSSTEIKQPVNNAANEEPAPIYNNEKPTAPIVNQQEAVQVKVKKEKKKGGAVKGIIIALVVILALGGGAAYAVPNYVMPELDYQNAETAFSEGDFTKSAELFDSLGGYKDSSDKATESRYQLAVSYAENGSYTEALTQLEILSASGYSDADSLALTCKYNLADGLYNEGSYENAAASFLELGDYEDSAQKYTESIFAAADLSAESGDYVKAIEIIDNSTIDPATAEEKTVTYRFAAAEEYAANGDFTAAVEIITPVSEKSYDNKPGSYYIKDYSYSAILAQIESGTADINTARQLAEFGSYKDSTMQYTKLCFSLGMSSFSTGDYNTAAALLTNANGYNNSSNNLKQTLYKIGEQCLANGDNASARSIYLTLADFSDSAAKREEAAKLITGGSNNGWYVDCETYVNSFCTNSFKSGDMISIVGTAGNENIAAPTTSMVVSIKFADGTTDSAACENIYKNGAFNAAFATTENMKGAAEITVMLSDTGAILRKLSVTIE